MAGTRKARVPMAEQIRLINECRRSGMTDADWCRENDIAVSTFYNWVSRCRKAAADQIPAANYGHLEGLSQSLCKPSNWCKIVRCTLKVRLFMRSSFMAATLSLCSQEIKSILYWTLPS